MLPSAIPPAARAEPAPLVPIEDFFRKPKRTGFDLSPDGRHLAWLAPWNSRLNLFVQTIGENEATQLTRVRERDVAGFAWGDNDRLVVSLDSGGDENFHLHLVDREGGSEMKDLTPFPGVRAQIEDELPDIPDQILVSMNRRDPRAFDVYRLTLSTGKLDLVAENPGNILGWQADHDGRVRAAVSSDGLETSILFRESETAPFRTILTTGFRTEVSPVAFTYDNKRLFAVSNLGRDMAAAVEIDPATGKEARVLFEDPAADVEAIVLSDHRKSPDAAVFLTDRIQYHFFSDTRAQIQNDLERRLPGREVRLADRSRDESRMLVLASSDRDPGTYYYYEPGAGKFEMLEQTRPWLNPADLAEMRPVAYQSRDGLTIHGYLTLPVGVEPKNLPLVVNPHGGPEGRDVWGFQSEVQFLANRGYAVFEPNFRISTGYGRKFWEAGFKQWGRAQQDDITDGVKWLIAQGIADPGRIAIYGASYGGYAALAGLAFTPDLYAAGVSYVGPSNLFTLLASIPPYWEPMRKVMQETVGDPKADRELFEQISPFFHADKITAPLFVAQGANDPRVKKAESDQIVGALRARGISVPYMVRHNEGHGFRNQENQFEFYRALEAFLAAHLGGRSTTPASVLVPLESAD